MKVNSRGKEVSSLYLEEQSDYEAYKVGLRALIDERKGRPFTDKDRENYVDLLLKHDRISSDWSHLSSKGD